MADLPSAFTSPLEVRRACRENRLTIYPSSALAGFLCVNVVMMHREFAEEFRAFCTANPVSCPLLAMLPAGCSTAPDYARDLDIRTDLRSYDVIRDGVNTGSIPSVESLFTRDTVTFLIGSSVSLDGYLASQGYGPAWGPCIYLTQRPCRSVGRYRGNFAVTMRAYEPDRVEQVAEITRHYPTCHGAPVAKTAQELGIDESAAPYLPWTGTPHPELRLKKLFWECGITPSLVAHAAKLPLMIVHTPGNALLTDRRTSELYDRFDLVAGLREMMTASRA